MLPVHLSRNLRSGTGLTNLTRHTLRRQYASKVPKRKQDVSEFEGAPGPNYEPCNPQGVPGRWSFRRKVFVTLSVVGGFYYVLHLERVPVTGRWRFMDIDPETEALLTVVSRKYLREEFGAKILPWNHLITQHVQRVTTRILEENYLGHVKASTPTAASWFFRAKDNAYVSPEALLPVGSEDKEWELMVVNDDKEVNAMASLGTIVVFTGILRVTKNDDGLAAVMGHEIAHVVAKHSLERYSSRLIYPLFSALLAVIGTDLGLASVLARGPLERRNYRKQELEADEIGLKLMARACYNPSASLKFFQRMEQFDKQNQGLNIGFLETHPTHKKRIDRLNKHLEDADSIRATNQHCTGIQKYFTSFVKAVVWGWT